LVPDPSQEEEGSGGETGVQYPCADRLVASPVGNKPTNPTLCHMDQLVEARKKEKPEKLE